MLYVHWRAPKSYRFRLYDMTSSSPVYCLGSSLLAVCGGNDGIEQGDSVCSVLLVPGSCVGL